MIGGMIVFILGALFGCGAFITVHRMFVEQTDKLRKRNEKLLERSCDDRVKLREAVAYRKGYYAGRDSKKSE